jgi:predicted lipoprotein with Yx(FWY)xxD motif
MIRRLCVIALSSFMAMLLAACGTPTTTGSSSSSSPSPTATTAPTSSASSAIIQTATASVKGNSETILTNTQGKALYYFTPDTATKAACTGACAQTWPPLLSTGSGTPTSATTLPGTLSLLTDANGSQVEYNGHLLYTYSGDTASGQTKGEGLFGKWFVATPTLSGSGGAQTTPTPGGYHYP